jgi:hypothetical protein
VNVKVSIGPDFSKYSLEELLDAQEYINQDLYPERYQEILSLIADKGHEIETNDPATMLKRTNFIDDFCFPSSITDKILARYEHLTADQISTVYLGLKEYFHICSMTNNKLVSMPSQVVDLAWHEFILFTRKYHEFCLSAFGKFLHHTSAEAMTSPNKAQDGIKLAWALSCTRANIQPRAAHKLPLLFLIDTMLDIPNGFKYSLNCSLPGNSDYCASEIGCGSGFGFSFETDTDTDTDCDGCGGCGGD